MGGLKKYFWTSSRCGRALFLAAPFGYGPRVAAENMAQLLGLRFERWRIDDNAGAKPNSAKLLLNFGVDSPPQLADSTYKVWVDCLMWLRRSLSKQIENYDLLLAESFFDARDVFQKLPTMRQISPLVTSDAPVNGDLNERRGKHILVSFGGVETPFTQDVHRWLFPTLILKALLQGLKERGDSRKIVCCVPVQLRERLSRVSEFSTIRFLSPNHEKFLRLLSYASLYVVQPGLYGPFEGFERRIPTAFCTPFSYTQICQARKYEEHGLLGFVPLWDELNKAIGSFEGQIESEEPYCFARLRAWLNEGVARSSNQRAFNDWAEVILNDSLVTDTLTNERTCYAQSRRNISNGYISSFSDLHD